MGVAFGDELGETVKKAKDRVANPPRMNIIVPVPVPKNKLGETFIVEEKLMPLSSVTGIFASCNTCKMSNCPNKGKPQAKFELYQSGKFPGKDEHGNIAPDMTCGDFNFAQIYKIYYERFDLESENSKFWIDELQNIANKKSNPLFENLRDLGKSFSTGELEEIVLDVIEHFKSKDGTNYKNDKLSVYARNHQNTKNYVNGVWEKFKDALPNEEYNLNKTKENKTFKKYINDLATRPKYNSTSDYVQGLAMIAHDTHGLKIDVMNYAYCPLKKVYTGVFRVDIYDHFGLNLEDVTEKSFEVISGFLSWFALQHFEGFNKKFKPFVTHFINDYPFSTSSEKLT